MTSNNTPAPAHEALLTNDEIRSLWVEHGLDDEAVEDFARAIESALLSKLRAPVADELSNDERAAIEALIECASWAFHAADDGEDDGSGTVKVPLSTMKELDAALEKMEVLPDDRPGYTMGPSGRAEWALRRFFGGTTIMGYEQQQSAALASAPVAGEAQAEQFIQAAIDQAPEPLRRLGEYLSRVLDEDQWATAERMLLGACNAAPQASETVRWVVTDDMRAAVRYAPSSAHWSERLKEFFGPDAREGINALEKQLREARADLDRQLRASEAVRDAGIDLEAAAKTLAECMDYPWAEMPEQGRTHMRQYAQSVVDAALSAQPGAPNSEGDDKWKSQTPQQIAAAMRSLARSEGFNWPEPDSAQPGAQKDEPWQPIETAPKDQVILLFAGLKKDGKVYAPHVNVGYWTEQFGWTCVVYAHQELAHIEPTHWMPRPPFPTQPSKDGGAEHG